MIFALEEVSSLMTAFESTAAVSLLHHAATLAIYLRHALDEDGIYSSWAKSVTNGQRRTLSGDRSSSSAGYGSTFLST